MSLQKIGFGTAENETFLNFMILTAAGNLIITDRSSPGAVRVATRGRGARPAEANLGAAGAATWGKAERCEALMPAGAEHLRIRLNYSFGTKKYCHQIQNFDGFVAMINFKLFSAILNEFG